LRAGITKIIVKAMNRVAPLQDVRDRMRKECKDEQWVDRGLTTCRYDARRGTRDAQTAAAAATKDQTAAETAVYTAACTETKLSLHTHQKVGDRPTLSTEAEYGPSPD
jgi:hypothetical protein